MCYIISETITQRGMKDEDNKVRTDEVEPETTEAESEV